MLIGCLNGCMFEEKMDKSIVSIDLDVVTEKGVESLFKMITSNPVEPLRLSFFNEKGHTVFTTFVHRDYARIHEVPTSFAFKEIKGYTFFKNGKQKKTPCKIEVYKTLYERYSSPTKPTYRRIKQ